MLFKRILTIILTIGMLLAVSSAQIVCAEEDRVKLDLAIKDETGWNAPKEELVFNNSTLVHTAPEGTNAVFGYTKEKYLNEVVEFDAVFQVVGAEVWQGIMLRSSNPSVMPWLTEQNKNYLVVVTEHQIELQRFGKRSKYLAVVPTPFKAGERVNIQFSAINVDVGVQLTFKVNGKTIINAIDNDEAAIKESGHVGFFNPSVLTILPSTRKPAQETPSVAFTNIEGSGKVGDPLTASYTYNDLTGDKEGKSIYRWYRTLAPIDAFGYGQKQLYPENFKEEYLEQIEGANDIKYVVTEDDSTFYLLFSVQPKSAKTGLLGEESFSNQIYVNQMDTIMASGAYFVADCPYALIRGTRTMIQAENEKFTPFVRENELYIPLRFIAESLGYSVTWNGEERTCSISKDNELKKIYNADDLIIKFDSLFMPISEAEEIFGIKSEYEPLNKLGIINDVCAGLNPVDYRVLLRNVKKAVEK